MDGFKNIEIKNFRGINYLKIEDFSRVNVFLGQNSSGKSSVLECLLLMMGMSNPDLPQALNRLRSRNNYAGVADARYMFNNLVLSYLPEITAELSNDAKRHLKLRLSYVFNDKEVAAEQNGPLPVTDTMGLINTLEMLFDLTDRKETKNYRSSLMFNQAGTITG